MAMGRGAPVRHRQREKKSRDFENKPGKKNSKQKRIDDKKIEAQEDAMEKQLFPHKFDDESHARVVENRPTQAPSWYEKQQAMTPSRSYKKKDKKEECQT